ncbi:MAG: DNA repair protein RecO [Flavobacteriales bacterium]
MASVDLPADRWVVLSSVAHGDSAWIVRALSRELGVIAVWTPVGKVKKRKVAMFHPMALLEVNGIHRKGSEGLYRFKEARRAVQMDALLTDVRRSAVAFFLAELVWRTLPEEHPHSEVADLLWSAATSLSTTDAPQHVHLRFLIGLVIQLGLAPEAPPSEHVPGFNLMTGEWEGVHLHSEDLWDAGTASAFWSCLSSAKSGVDHPKLPGEMRRRLVPGMVRYIQHHLSGLKTIKSLQVLEEVFA